MPLKQACNVSEAISNHHKSDNVHTTSDMPLIVVERIYTANEISQKYPTWKQDTLTLSWEDRCKSHGKRTSDGGLVFGLSLASGKVLTSHDYLVLEREQMVIRVVEMEEDVYILTPENVQEWASLAYQIGNRHQLLMIGHHELICLQEPGVQKLFEQLGVAYRTGKHSFTPVLNVSGHSH